MLRKTLQALRKAVSDRTNDLHGVTAALHACKAQGPVKTKAWGSGLV